MGDNINSAQQHLQKDLTDQVLKVIIVSTDICTNKLNPDNRVIQFIKASTKPKKTEKTKPNIMSPSTDWELTLWDLWHFHLSVEELAGEIN